MCKIAIIGGKGTAVNIANVNDKYVTKDGIIGYRIDNLLFDDIIGRHVQG